MSHRSPLHSVIRFCVENKPVALGVLAVVVLAGLAVAPFDVATEDALSWLPRDPVPVDAIPNYGENQQIVYTEWPGRSPQDVEDQITYPLTAALLGTPSVHSVRSYSYFGFSSIFVVFKDEAEFYWSRSRILEKLASLPPDALPQGVQPTLGPDATPLGQIFWYTLEGRDADGQPAGGWDLQELRSIQDWQVRFALMGVPGVSEVASVGGFVKEYQIDVDPDALRAHGVRLAEVFRAVRHSNVDVGARTIEVNSVEYVIRSRGFLKSIADIEETVIRVGDNVPIRIRDVATVTEGPALRRGALDKDGEEAVGGTVVVRFDENPMTAIRRVRDKIEEIAAGLPKKTLPDGRVSQVTIVPFYDRTDLIRETLGTLDRALFEEIIVTAIVVLLMVMHLRSAFLITGLLPVAVLLSFLLMKGFGVDANVVALAGIAIAIGTMVDMAIVLCENIHKRLEEAEPSVSRRETVIQAATEVAGSVAVALLTTVVSFLPILAMDGPDGKLFRPLAYTKTFALIAAGFLAIFMVPPLAHIVFTNVFKSPWWKRLTYGAVILIGIVVAFQWSAFSGFLIALFGAFRFATEFSGRRASWIRIASGWIAAAVLIGVLTAHWTPVGAEHGWIANLLFVGLGLGSVLGVILGFYAMYPSVLRLCLRYKLAFLCLPVVICYGGLVSWQSLGRETPRLSEGSFLYMPTTMPHASIGEAVALLKLQDAAIRAIPEVDVVVGKIGRVSSALDPAPVSMVETVISYKPEYRTDPSGRRLKFRYDTEAGRFARGEEGELIEDEDGRPYRQWRAAIRTEGDIWNEIESAARVLGSTSAPKLQPIETRLVMLASGMRAPMGVKVFAPDSETLETASRRVESVLRDVPSILPETVNADQVVGKPYLEIKIDRPAIARYGIAMADVQEVIEVAVGGKRLTTTVEERERYPVRVRFQRELRDSIESLGSLLMPTPDGTYVPLRELATIDFERGPMVVKSEDTRLVSYVTFDRRPGLSEIDVVEEAQRFLLEAERDGRFERPAGATYHFAGTYERYVAAAKRLAVLITLALAIIILLLYLKFRSAWTAAFIFSGVVIAGAGGFLLLWLYGQEGFLDFSVGGVHLRDLFHVRPYHLSPAVWVGFLALFGIATDDGVIMATYIERRLREAPPRRREDIAARITEAALRRIRPCLMTVATTILALVPVLTSYGRGADILVPMGIPVFGGMLVALITILVVPTLYAIRENIRWWRRRKATSDEADGAVANELLSATDTPET